MLRTDKYQIPVSLPEDMPAPDVGALMRVTGVCDLHPGRDVILLSTASTTFSLLTRSPTNLVVVKAPSWWTRERLFAVLISVGVALLVALGWVVALRRRVAQRSRQLADEVQARREVQVAYDATAAERKRLAGELHDSLEQGLTGVALQLDAAVMGLPTPPPPLVMARTLLSHCRTEVRRAVWDLNADEREERDLPARLRAAAEQAIAGRDVQVVVDVRGEPTPAAGLVAHHLSRITQESAHNAVRHGGAHTITITISFASHLLELTISDDGAGFDPATAVGPAAGHFGVQGMRERTHKMGGDLALTSVPGAGTTITVQVPLTGAVP
ncbi:MAG TPA: sensor histidine kinase [Planctomycetota bacterium]|nr:sensor histidine kinase [Planctomycetota bacterium]